MRAIGTTFIRIIGIAFAAATTAGCGASALPAAQVVPPQEDIRAADEIGAEQNPQAALHLKYAKDEIARANQFMDDGDKSAAQFVLLRADADAKLALELAREEKARIQAQDAQSKIAELQQKTQPTP